MAIIIMIRTLSRLSVHSFYKVEQAKNQGLYHLQQNRVIVIPRRDDYYYYDSFLGYTQVAIKILFFLPSSIYICNEPPEKVMDIAEQERICGYSHTNSMLKPAFPQTI